jgi:integrase/recombinase XerD
MSDLSPLLQAFFTDRLMTQRQASPNTIAAYRDTFRLLLAYTAQQTGTAPSRLTIEDLDATRISGFLSYLETERGNSTRSRNARLAAIHSLFSYAALRHPEHALIIQRVLAIPCARHKRNLVSYLDDAETTAILAACDQSTRTGRRDHALITLATQTGLRISELISLTVADIHTGTGANVHCTGKGRKERRTPLLPTTVQILGEWIAEIGGDPGTVLFAGPTGRSLSRDAIERRITRTAQIAATACPSLNAKNITAHTLRHTAAMRLLHSGVDVTVIALWLGHAQVTTTNIYLHADMALKEAALAKTTPLGSTVRRYKPADNLLAFLESL